MMYDLPNGWTCCSCGDEYPKDFIGEHIALYDNGTYCKQCQVEIIKSDTVEWRGITWNTNIIP